MVRGVGAYHVGERGLMGGSSHGVFVELVAGQTAQVQLGEPPILNTRAACAPQSLVPVLWDDCEAWSTVPFQSSGQDRPVQSNQLLCVAFDIEPLLENHCATFLHSPGELEIVQYPVDGLGQPRRRTRRNQKAVTLVHDDFVDPRDIGAHQRFAQRHALHQRETQPFPEGAEGHHVSQLQDVVDILAGAEEVEVALELEMVAQPFQVRPFLSIPGEEELCVGLPIHDDPGGLHQGIERLRWVKTGRADHRGAAGNTQIFPFVLQLSGCPAFQFKGLDGQAVVNFPALPRGAFINTISMLQNNLSLHMKSNTPCEHLSGLLISNRYSQQQCPHFITSGIFHPRAAARGIQMSFS